MRLAGYCLHSRQKSTGRQWPGRGVRCWDSRTPGTKALLPSRSTKSHYAKIVVGVHVAARHSRWGVEGPELPGSLGADEL